MPVSVRIAPSLMVLGSSISACGGLFNTEAIVDAKHDSNGNLILLDTPRMWDDWTDSVDRGVENERAGRRPPGGAPSWNDVWLTTIAANRASRENAPKYIAYIVKARREAGLPELQGYP